MKQDQKKVEAMQDILTKLEDIKNSQESIVEKVGQVQVELFNNPDQDLEKQLDDFLTNSSNSHEFIVDLVEAFEQKVKSNSKN